MLKLMTAVSRTTLTAIWLSLLIGRLEACLGFFECFTSLSYEPAATTQVVLLLTVEHFLYKYPLLIPL